MQRIDENTYIDDTLVTCAEYQLFIDEMREQGKYYQPDHWASYQFPKGQAREPILGVRHSDAMIFCEWLTKREADGWRYRLPIVMEAEEYPVKPDRYSFPLGYWILISDKKDRFVWIGPIPDDPRDITSIIYSLNEIGNIARPLDLDNVRDIVHALNIDIVSDFSYIKKAINSSRAIDLTPAIPGRKIRFTLIDPTQLLASNDNIPTRSLDRTDPRHPLARNESDFTPSPESVDLDLDVDLLYDLYIDDHTLKQRIAGRSPAFEGIRLVKERIR